MHVYWAEFTISWADQSVTGNDAREKVRTDLGVAVEGDDAVSPAKVRWRGVDVCSELVAVAIRKLIEEQDKPWTLVYKPSRRIRRANEVFDKLDIESAAQREEQNRHMRKPPVYAIIGRGASAVVDHTTLRQTTWGRDRVGDAEIVHIGFEDPWGHYNQHEMGQFPHLLGVPGYERRPDLTNEDPAAPRDSTIFAGDTAHELARLQHAVHERTGQNIRIFPYCVALIQPRGETVHDSVKGSLVQEGLDLDALEEMLAMNHAWKRGRYRMLLVSPEGELSWGYADMIDICTGAGKARAIDETMASEDLRDATRTRIWEPAESWDERKKTRAIMAGTEALYREATWTDGQRVCVMGSGGVGVNMIERARDTNAYADWLATKTLHASFVIGRNDILLKHPLGPPRNGAPMEMDEFEGRGDQLAVIDPRDRKWRFGQGCDIAEVVPGAGGQVRVKLKASRTRYETTPSDPSKEDTGIAAKIRDYGETESVLTDGAFPFSELTRGQLDPDYTPDAYDRLIRAAGQDIRDVGQSEKLAMQIALSPIEGDIDGRMVGLQAEDESLRVLGAAATGNAQLVDRNALPVTKMRQYHESLPAQGQIIYVGFVFSMLNVAKANHYFDETPNDNINTMSEAELTALWDDASLAKKTVALRCTTQSGFLWADRSALLLSHPRLLTTWQAAGLFPTFAEIVAGDSRALYPRAVQRPSGVQEWREMLGILGLLPAFARKIIRAHIARGPLDRDALDHELGEQEKADALELTQIRDAGLLAHGWERNLQGRWVRENLLAATDVEEITRRIQYRRLAEWIIESRTAHGGPWPTLEDLISDIRRRFRLKHDRRTEVEPLPADWSEQIDAAVEKLRGVRTKYRPADPILFPEQ